MKRSPFQAILILLFVLGCSNEITDLNAELNNPLDLEQVECGLPALAFAPNIFDINRATNGVFTAEIFLMDSINSEQVYGGTKAVVSYNPEMLEFLGVNNGELSAGSAPLFFVDDTTTAGRIEIISIFVSGDSTGVSGSNNVLVAGLEFRALMDGISNLSFERVESDTCAIISTTCELVDPNDDPLSIMGFIDGMVNAY